jgi:hypothetical protein
MCGALYLVPGERKKPYRNKTTLKANRIRTAYIGGSILLDIKAGVRLAALYTEETSYCRRVTAQELALGLILSVFL